MFTIKDWHNKPAEITVDNFYKQSFEIEKDGMSFLYIHAGMCGMCEIELYFNGEIEKALTVTLNNIAWRGLDAIGKIKENNLDFWHSEGLDCLSE